jgi:hypothetical protein
MPDDTTPWESILDFRADPEARRRLLALKAWMRGLGGQDVSLADVAERLAELTAEYEASLRLRRMKVRLTTTRALVTSVAGIAEDVLKFRWGRAAERLFAVQEQRIQLFEAERALPGREIAYLHDASGRFGRRE